MGYFNEKDSLLCEIYMVIFAVFLHYMDEIIFIEDMVD
jgi:hypothetical protein